MMEAELIARIHSETSIPACWGAHGGASALPRAALFRVSAVEDYSNDGRGLISGRVQVDVYAETFAEAEAAAKQVRGALAGYAGGVVQGVFLTSIRDAPDSDFDQLHRVSMTFQLTYTD